LLVADNARLTSRGRAVRNEGQRAGGSYSRLAGRATVPIFLLVPQVRLRKRLDVEGAAQKWARLLPGLIETGPEGRDRRNDAMHSAHGANGIDVISR
jgi:hypothetical protein